MRRLEGRVRGSAQQARRKPRPPFPAFCTESWAGSPASSVWSGMCFFLGQSGPCSLRRECSVVSAWAQAFVTAELVPEDLVPWQTLA